MNRELQKAISMVRKRLSQSISEQLKTLSEVIQKDSLKKTSRKRRVGKRAKRKMKR